MKIGRWARLLLVAAPLLAGCGNFWQSPSGGSGNGDFSLSNSGAISVAPGATTGNTATITVTPSSSSYTGTVSLACAVTSSPSSAIDPPSCALSPTSVTFSSDAAQTSTLTATTASDTTTGSYEVTVTASASGVSSLTTSVCVLVSASAGTCTPPAGNSGNFYILNNPTSGSPGIYSGSIKSGALNKISGSYSTVEGISFNTTSTMAMAPNGNFLDVSTGAGVFAYPIANGALQSPTLASSDTDANAIKIDRTSTWLVEAHPMTGGVTLSALPVSSSTGAFDSTRSSALAICSVNVNAAIYDLAISQDNAYVFVALGLGGTLVVPFNPSNPFPSTLCTAGSGGLIISPVNNSVGSALSVAVDPSSTPRLFYIGETNVFSSSSTGGLRAFNYSSLPGAFANHNLLTQAGSSPIASGGAGPSFILPVSSPDDVYVADIAGNIYGFAISGTSPSFTIAAGGSVATGAEPKGLAVDSTGSYVFSVSYDGSPFFDAYTFDGTTAGLLDSLTDSTASAGSIAIVAAPAQ